MPDLFEGVTVEKIDEQLSKLDKQSERIKEERKNLLALRKVVAPSSDQKRRGRPPKSE